MFPTVRIVFSGEILPGYDPEAVKQHIGVLLKLRPGQLEHVFSGHPVILRKGLPEAEAPRYQERLLQTGIRVHIQTEQPEPSTPVPPATAETPATSVTPTTNIALDATQTQAPPDDSAAAAEVQAGENTRATPSHTGNDAALFGLDFKGRLGRLNYLTGMLAIVAFGTLAVLPALPGWLAPEHAIAYLPAALLGLLLLVLGVLALRLVCLRLHDMGHSGRWSLLLLVPYANLVGLVALGGFVGMRGRNAWGLPPAGMRLRWLFGALLGFGITAFALVQTLTFHPALDRANRAAASGAAGKNQIVMYSLTNCEYCRERREQLRAAGIPVTEYFIDTDPARKDELTTKINQSDLPARPYGAPIFEINGELLPDNPPMQEIREHLQPPAKN